MISYNLYNKNYCNSILVMLLKSIQRKCFADVVCQKGKNFLEKDYSFFCAACGNVSCSPECHLTHYTHQNICTFQENFVQQSGAHSLPSIVSKNIKLAQKNKLPVGKILNKTSTFFIMAYNHPKQNWVYLQRGYRQYGDPIEENFAKFKIFANQNIDFYKLKKRTCVCNCYVCADKFDHSVLNCSQICDAKNQQLKIGMDELFDFNKLNQICHCNCELCTSGIANLTHMLRDCFGHCEHNVLMKELERD